MNKIQLIIGNRNYSSWSFRAWLCLRKSGAQFEELLLPLDTPEFEEKIGDYSPTRRVPVLWDDGQCIWDSLAICEYAATKSSLIQLSVGRMQFLMTSSSAVSNFI